MILIKALGASFLTFAAAVNSPTPDPAPVVRRLAATATLAAQEYQLGVQDGTVILAAEVEEARLFLIEARRSASQLPAEWSEPAMQELDALLELVGRVAPPEEIAGRVRRLTTTLSAGLGVSLDEVPQSLASLVRGAEIYRTQCASCHGTAGRGDGPQAASLDPVPANLADHRALADRSPLDFYRRITIGVVGTAMPAYETRLTPDERWAVASYVSTLRLPPAAGQVPAALASFGTTARMSDVALAQAMGGSEQDSAMLARIAAVRTFEGEQRGAAIAATIEEVRLQVDEALRLAAAGQHEQASTTAFDAYMTFEQVERDLRAKDAQLAGALEAAFATLRTRTAGGAAAGELTDIRATLLGELEKAERILGDALSPRSLFLQSLFLIIREGLEAILIVGALLTFLARTGASNRRRDVHVGVVAAVIASLVMALLIETVFQLSPARQEVLEGVTMLTAAGVLFYVSYWLLSKIELARWTDFMRSRVHEAVSSGSALALASAAFLAVFREGFETVLFYKALVIAGPAGATTGPVLGGLLLGSLVLVGVYVAINRFGVRLPLKPFFAITGLFLYYMAFVFAGRGVAELQEGRLIPMTVLPWAPRIPAIGVYPTVESLAAQALLVGALVVAVVVLLVRRAPRGANVRAMSAPPEKREAREVETLQQR